VRFWVRILWSPSPHASAELFDELKKGRDQPEASKAATIGVDIIDEFNTDKYNPQVRDFLSKLPGVTSKNIYALLNTCENLLDLLSLPQV
jgi:DNA excision repair protein ERCC-4